MSRRDRQFDYTEVDPDRFAIKLAGGNSYILYEKEFQSNHIRFMWKNGNPSITSGSILLSIPEVKQIAQINGLK